MPSNPIVQPPKPIALPSNPIVQPPKPIVQPPKPIALPSNPIVRINQPPKPIVQPPKPIALPSNPIALPSQQKIEHMEGVDNKGNLILILIIFSLLAVGYFQGEIRERNYEMMVLMWMSLLIIIFIMTEIY